MNIKRIAGILAVSMALACATAQAQDACAGMQNCIVDGAVRANVSAASGINERGTQKITVRVSFTNLGNTPLILNYKHGSGKMAGENGQEYRIYWSETSTSAVAGIPVSTRNKASSQFTLAPGQSRTASFRFERIVGKGVYGTVFEPSLVVEEYELLPSNQLRLAGEHPLYFGPLRAGVGAASAVETVKGLRDLFKKK